MVTLKQIEAVHWVEKLGSFHAAAERLNTTQSTISKRIQEIEACLGFSVFDRASKTAQPTLRGRELLGDFARMLDLRHGIMRQAGDDRAFSGQFRLGVTEMVALTWLSPLIRSITETFPEARLTARVDLTRNLVRDLAACRLDLALCPSVALEEAADFPSRRLGALESAWMCAPSVAARFEGVLSAKDLAELPLLTFAEGSLLHGSMTRALAERGVVPRHTITCNSMIALAELAENGIGVSYLPRDYFQVHAGDRLTVLTTNVPIPPLEYAAIYRDDFIDRSVAELARRVCDFSHPRK
ncbi:LysR family transcriptional regulator [Siculibacillus lacustris]|nr:LysR family transcriptional regulator [Siculibacillus lacustris]